MSVRLPNQNDLLMWVGTAFYPTIQSFVEEAMVQGVAKRIPKLNKGIEPGVRVFLAHSEGRGKGHGVIFGYFLITHIEIIVKDEAQKKEFEEAMRTMSMWREMLDGEQIQFFTEVEIREEPHRFCGRRYFGAYLRAANLTGEEFETLYEEARRLGNAAEILGPLVVFKRPVDYRKAVERSAAHFRGYRWVDGERILSLVGDPNATLNYKRVPVRKSFRRSIRLGDNQIQQPKLQEV